MDEHDEGRLRQLMSEHAGAWYGANNGHYTRHEVENAEERVLQWVREMIQEAVKAATRITTVQT